MSNLEAGTRVFLDIPITAGINTATAPTLFMKADIVPHTSMVTRMSLASLSPERRRIREPNKSATPVL